ncbi:hypothetical protein ScPMuIL_015471 [Solemya velum]
MYGDVDVTNVTTRVEWGGDVYDTAILLVMVNSEKTEDSVMCSKDVDEYGDPDGYSRDRFILVLLGKQQVIIKAIHPCVSPHLIPIEINSNPAGVQVSYHAGYIGKQLSNSGGKHMGIVMEIYYLPDVLINVIAGDLTLSQLIPVRLQGSEYFAVFPKNVAIERFFICVVTVSNNTEVQVGVKQFDNHTHNDVYVVSLTFIEPFVVSKIFDMSGSRILSRRAVAVNCMFSLHGNVGIIESLPVKVLGKQFVLFPLQLKTERIVRIVTVAGSTYISQLNTTSKLDCLPRGHVVDIDQNFDGWGGITTFRANRPLLVLETVVYFNQSNLVSPVEQYNTYIMNFAYTRNPYVASCIFINFSPIELNFTLSVTDIVSSRKASAPFSTNTTYFDTSEFTRSLASMNEIVHAYGVINITSSAKFSGTCVITDAFATFEFGPYHLLGVIYQDCRLLEHEARCSNCNATYTDDCQGRNDTQHGCSIEGDDVNSTVLISTTITSVVLLAASSMLAAKQAMKYKKRKARRRVRPE